MSQVVSRDHRGVVHEASSGTPIRKQPNGDRAVLQMTTEKAKHFQFSHKWECRAQHCVKQTLYCFSKYSSLYDRSPIKSVRPYSSRPCPCSLGGKQPVLSFICLHRHILFMATEPACQNHHDHKALSCMQCFPSCLRWVLYKWDSSRHLPSLGSCLSFGCLHRALHSFGSKMAPSPARVFVHSCSASACCK